MIEHQRSRAMKARLTRAFFMAEGRPGLQSPRQTMPGQVTHDRTWEIRTTNGH